MFPRLAFAIVGLVTALFTSQLPEFAQQYRQRLSGAIDELRNIIAQFDREAQQQNITPEAAMERLRSNPDQLAQYYGTDMHEWKVRLQRLETEFANLNRAGPMVRIVVLVENFDPGIARRAVSNFEPAVPTSAEGIVSAIVGFFIGGGLLHLIGTPFRRRKDRRQLAASPFTQSEAEAARAEARLLRQRINRYTLPRVGQTPTKEKR